MMAYSSSPAASSFYSSVLSGPGPATECSLSLKSTGAVTNALATPHRNRLTSRFQHSKSHSISGSREATPVRIVGGGVGSNRRANSEKFDRQKTASLPLPKRRQLSLSATNSTGRPDPEQPAATELEDDDEEARAERARRARISVLNEDVFNMSTGVPDTCSFVTITGTAFSNQQRRDSNCTLNSNSYKEQYILGSNYNNNINRHSRDHYDSMHRLKDLDLDLTPDHHSDQLRRTSSTPRSATIDAAPRDSSPSTRPNSDQHRPTVEPKPHHYETNRKSLQDIL
ncbi:hypothetical protein quinque_010730 [Culex quinquefasciatus]